MNTYIVSVSVRYAHGRQEFRVRATSPEEAVKLWHDGEGDIVYEEFEADDYGTPKVEEGV